MPTVADKPALGRAGSALWDDVVARYDLRVDEVRVLEHAARMADLIVAMDRQLAEDCVAGGYTVTGVRGTRAVHPLVSELRMCRKTYADLLRQLHLPDTPASAAAKAERDRESRSRGGRNRWSRPHAVASGTDGGGDVDF